MLIKHGSQAKVAIFAASAGLVQFLCTPGLQLAHNQRKSFMIRTTGEGLTGGKRV
jgi:hypothetical protein